MTGVLLAAAQQAQAVGSDSGTLAAVFVGVVGVIAAFVTGFFTWLSRRSANEAQAAAAVMAGQKEFNDQLQRQNEALQARVDACEERCAEARAEAQDVRREYDKRLEENHETILGLAAMIRSEAFAEAVKDDPKSAAYVPQPEELRAIEERREERGS